jgi:hypothetical protein
VDSNLRHVVLQLLEGLVDEPEDALHTLAAAQTAPGTAQLVLNLEIGVMVTIFQRFLAIFKILGDF